MHLVRSARSALSRRSLACLSFDRIGSSQANPHMNGDLSHPGAPDAPLNLVAKRKIAKYQSIYANHHGTSFLPSITSTSTRMRGMMRHAV